MIEQGLNYADSTVIEMTDYFETRVENLERKENRNISSTITRKTKKKSLKMSIEEDSDASVLESSKESS